MATTELSEEKLTSTTSAKTPIFTPETSSPTNLADNVSAGGSAVESQEKFSSSTSDVEPTDWEMANLRRVGEGIPPAVFLVAIAEMAERFIYRCMTGPLRTCFFDDKGLHRSAWTDERTQRITSKIQGTMG